jgi:hypothetical protein
MSNYPYYLSTVMADSGLSALDSITSGKGRELLADCPGALCVLGAGNVIQGAMLQGSEDLEICAIATRLLHGIMTSAARYEIALQKADGARHLLGQEQVN